MIEKDGYFYTCELKDTGIDISNIAFNERNILRSGSIICTQKFDTQTGTGTIRIVEVEKIYTSLDPDHTKVTFTFNVPQSDKERELIEFVKNNLSHFELKASNNTTHGIAIFNLVQTSPVSLKVFLSHVMSGIPVSDVMKIRKKAKEYLEEKYGDVEIIDNYNHSDAPENAGRLWHLGRSIQQMEKADAVYFCSGFELANGCCVEMLICKLYGLRVLK